MLRQSVATLRYRTAWRELLHPLPVGHRRSQWLKRDQVEINEAVLREPYYLIKPYAKEDQMRDSTLRNELVFPGEVGPQVDTSTVPQKTFALQRRHPHTWKTVPPHQPSRHDL